MTTAFRFANASGQVHHGAFSKRGPEQVATSSGLKLPHQAISLNAQLDGGSPTPNVEGRGRGQRHMLAQASEAIVSVCHLLIAGDRNARANGPHQTLGLTSGPMGPTSSPNGEGRGGLRGVSLKWETQVGKARPKPFGSGCPAISQGE
jgi:hypothetical protein